jgi:hypothetical protein
MTADAFPADPAIAGAVQPAAGPGIRLEIRQPRVIAHLPRRRIDNLRVGRVGGKHWQHVGLDDSRHFCKILVDPQHPDSVLVGALGHYFGPNGRGADAAGYVLHRHSHHGMARPGAIPGRR